MDKKKQVLDTFTKENKPLKSGEVAQITGLDTKEVSKLIKELKTEGKIYSPKRCYYDIKK